MGFEGLLQLACKELRYELITQIIVNYDVSHHRLHMVTKIAIPVIPKDVSEVVIGILDNGVDIVVYNRRSMKNHTNNMQILEGNLHIYQLVTTSRNPSSSLLVPLSFYPTQKGCMTYRTQFGIAMWLLKKIRQNLSYNLLRMESGTTVRVTQYTFGVAYYSFRYLLPFHIIWFNQMEWFITSQI